MVTKLITTRTADQAEIYSILYSNKKQNSKIVVLIHGACMNFLTGFSKFVPQLTKCYGEFDFLAVNTRAHDLGFIVSNFAEKAGWAWQELEKNRYDLDSVFAYLSKCGYSEIVLCGHSWGGLICMDYLQKYKHKVANLILLSPTIKYKLLLEVNFKNSVEEVIYKAQNLFSMNKQNEIIRTDKASPIPFMSAKTILEFNTSTFDAKDFLEGVDFPTYIVVGEMEHKKLIEFSKDMESRNGFVKSYVINKANHFYSNHEIEVVDIIDSILGGIYHD